MEAEFWQQSWTENKIGFHQEKVNSRLKKYWSDLHLSMDERIFVPLCGKSKDMLWLRDQGHSVIGVELSDKACREFFTGNNLEFKTFNKQGFEIFVGDKIELWAGNLFDLTKDHLDNVNGVYDRASLVALPQPMRKQYVDHLTKILPAGSKALVISMEYDEAKMKGPPFSISEAEVRTLFQGSYSVDLIGQSEGPDIVGNLRQRGLDTLTEKIYLVKKPDLKM